LSNTFTKFNDEIAVSFEQQQKTQLTEQNHHDIEKFESHKYKFIE